LKKVGAFLKSDVKNVNILVILLLLVAIIGSFSYLSYAIFTKNITGSEGIVIKVGAIDNN